MARIGYIGLGIMGAAMARNLMKAGHELVVHNRSRAIVDSLAAEGASAASSPAEVAGQVEFVCTNLPDSPDVEQVVLGPEGILEGARPGTVFIDNSTIKPETARMLAERLAAKDVQALDAPVSGGDVGARDGTLTIMVGGPQEAFDRSVSLFEATGKAWVLVGDSGAGQIAKVCNQIIVGAQMASLAEALITAQKAGVDPQRVVDAIKGGAAQMWTLDVKPPRLFAGNRQPGFKAYMQHKDHGIILDTARTYGIPLPVSAVIHQLYAAMLEQGNRELDNSAIVSVYESLAQINLDEPDR
ncbi:MAG: NAD(P)-binding domain-containing protein [Anaerolineaceae bacterium]|nr:NAD(P)-binding domain-containing protein [Anaerolineaceae bacterium]MDE0329995.1 NAD(P)-binding domain-containing protein [Anaerolineaceae bacterium]